jgi:NAD(P)H-hydrate epimerase
MKILNANQIKNADAFTIKQEGISSFDLMERAAEKITQQLIADFPLQQVFHIFCGPGNNGGDGLAVARLLIHEGKKVFVYLLKSDNYSADNLLNQKRLAGFVSLQFILLENTNQIPVIGKEELIVDAILGIGINKPISGLIQEIILKLNEIQTQKIAIDIPTGLNSDGFSGDLVMNVNKTYTFHCPKLAFMMPENDVFIGDFTILDIGLQYEADENETLSNFYIDEKLIKSLYKPRKKYSHKGTFGHGLLVAGNKGKMGAAVLSAKGAMRSGIGLLTTHVPGCGIEIMQIGCSEAMVSTSESEDYISDLPQNVNDFSTIAIGPGIGQKEESGEALLSLIKLFKGNLILDADALNLLSANKHWFKYLNEKMILTPHPGEFKRLVGNWKNDFEKIEIQRKFSIENNCIVVLKGAHTSISMPNGKIYFNSTGNNGMSTGGSGDVLTGIILGLTAIGYEPNQAAIFGVYLHGLAGDLAAKKQSCEALIASDIIEYLGSAFGVIKSK